VLEWDSGKLLFDCGSGVLHGMARDGIDWRAITHVALSHCHTDHIGDLAPLLFAWTQGLAPSAAIPRTLLGPPGLTRILRGLAQAHGDFVFAPGGSLAVVELDRRGRWEDPSGLVVSTTPARHTAEAVALRVEFAGRVVGYTGDGGPHDSLAPFFRGADVLISECGIPDGSKIELHMTPLDVAALARDAAPRHLVVTHLYPGADRASLEGVLRAYGSPGSVVVADDGHTVTF
jgi:ribonuclease BN (tRNA processing enzyme)